MTLLNVTLFTTQPEGRCVMTEDLAREEIDLWGQGDGKSRAARSAEILLTLSRYGFGDCERA